MFKCKVCAEKDARIADLKEQISHQRIQITPPPRVNTYEMEENYLLQGGNEEQLQTVSQEDQRKESDKLRAIEEERERILGGSTWEQ
jgi:hypothetical protein